MNVKVLPEIVPLTVPVPFTPEAESVIDRVPVSEAPDWVSDHVIEPLPLESVAVPDHVPFTVAVVGDVEPEDEEGDVVVAPPQPAALTANANAVKDTRANCVKIIGRLADFITAELVT